MSTGGVLMLFPFAAVHRMSLNVPRDIKCIKDGSSPDDTSCECWDASGEALAGKKCHSPVECLIKGSDDLHGDFHYTALNKGDSLDNWLKKSGVPSKMTVWFKRNAAKEASEFTPFKYVVSNGKAGTAKTYVGVARAFNNTRQLGIAIGTEDASGNRHVQPYRCNGDDYPHGVKRDLTDDEIKNIAAGCEAYAWKAAAAKAFPQEAAVV